MWIPKRQDRRERERPSCLALSSSKREFDLGRPRRTQTTSFSVGGFFFNSAQAPGDIMRRELDFFCYPFRECSYIPTYLMQKRNKSMETTRNISRPPTDPFLFSLSVYTKDEKKSMSTVPYPRKIFSFFPFTKTSHTSILYWKVCPMSTCILEYCCY